MRPINFPEGNAIYAENQPEYERLPAYRDQSGQVVSCWKMTWRERIRVLFTGQIWLTLHTFNQPLQPVFMTTEKSDIFGEGGQP